MSVTRTLTFADLLRRHRAAAGLTQEELAARAGLSAHGISDLESGRRRTPRRDTLALLTEALGLSAADRMAFEAVARHRDPSALAPTAAPAPARPGAPTTPLVGREDELALIERLLAGDGPPLVALAGEPGIGKTRLLREAAARAAARGWTVLEGGCHRRSGQEPYAPVLGVVEAYLSRRLPAQRRLDLRGCARLVRLLPELAESGDVTTPTWTLPAEQERRLTFAAVGRYLANVAGPAGTLLVLDDLQWAGPDALDLLGALARAPADRPPRALLAYRDTEVRARDPLAMLLADLAHDELALRRAVEPLPRPAAAALLEELLAPGPWRDERLRERVLRRAGGVPFYLVCWARAPRTSVLGVPVDAGKPVDAGVSDVGPASVAAEDAVPATVAEAIRVRVAALPEPAQELLGAAAVIGRVASRSLLVAVAADLGQSERAVVAALDDVCGARLLAEGDADGYQFNHDLVREVVASDLTAARRALLHRCVAEALERVPGPPANEALAYHYLRAGVAERAIVYLERAAARAEAMHAHAEAERQYRALVRHLHALGRTAAAARAGVRLAGVLIGLARLDEAIAVLRRAGDDYRDVGDLEGLGQAVALAGRAHAHRGTAEDGIALVLPLLAPAGARVTPRVLAALHEALTYLYFVCGRYVDELASARATMELAEVVVDPTLLMQGGCAYGDALEKLGRFGEAARVMEEIVPQAEAGGDQWCLGHALNSSAYIALKRGDLEVSRRWNRRALETAERTDDPTMVALMTVMSAMIALWSGDWPRARGEAERALAAVRQVGRSFRSAYPPLVLGMLDLFQGGRDTSPHQLDEAITLAEQSHDLQVLWYAQSALAERDLLSGRPEGALAHIEPLWAGTGEYWGDAILFLSLLAWAYGDLGEAARAETLLARGIDWAAACGARPAFADLRRVQALLLVRWDRAQEAVPAAEEALELARAMAAPYAEAKALYVYGLLEARRGELGRARERLRAALAILERLGERLYVEAVGHALAELPRT